MKLTLCAALLLTAAAYLVVEVPRIGDAFTEIALESELQDAKERRKLARVCEAAWPRNKAQQKACMEGLPG